MRKIVEFSVLGFEACPWSVPYIGRFGGSFRKKKSQPEKGILNLADWQDKVREAAITAMFRIPLQLGPIHLDFTFYAETPKGHRHGELWAPAIRWSDTAEKGKGGWVKDNVRGKTESDVGNLTKGTEDALEKIVYANDVQVRMRQDQARYGISPGVLIRVWAIEDGDFPGEGAKVK